MEDFGNRWNEVNRQERCQTCNEQGRAFEMIECASEQCNKHFHKSCVNPMLSNEEWDGEELFCDDCANVCLCCGSGEDIDENPLIVCDNCEELWHWACLEEFERCKWDEIGNEEAPEWICPECDDEYGSDIEWARENIVDDDQMDADDCFTRSDCQCQVCSEMNNAVDTWDSFRPNNPISQSLKNAIDANQDLVTQVMDNIHFKHGKPLPKC